jgi:bifunctional non-homologous end joining protein LigD
MSLKLMDKTEEIQLVMSRPEKVLFPEDGITKGELIRYYHDIAEVMLPYIQGRPTTMQRYPDGIHGIMFYQKQVPDYFPDWIEQVAVEKEPTPRDPATRQCQVVCERAETLMYLANQSCITPHTWLSRKPDLCKPDRLIFDFDPSGEDFDFVWVKDGARRMRDMLTVLNLPTYVMATGSRGLHVVVPIRPELDFDQVKPLARKLAHILATEEPERFTIELRKKERGNRIFVDYLRNDYAQTSVPPYAVRPKHGAPVATPLAWEELDDPALTSQQYTLRTIFERLDQVGDPWAGMDEQATSLKPLVASLPQLGS